MTSLRRRVVVSAVVIAATALLASGLLVFLLVRAELLAHADGALLAQARTMGALVEYDDERRRCEFTGAGLLVAEGDGLRLRIATWDGDAVATSATPPPAEPAAEPSPAAVAGDAVAWDWWSGDGVRWRALSARARSQREEGGQHDSPGIALRVTIARPMLDLDRRLRRIAWLLAGVTVAVVAALAGALAVVLRRSLVPLERFAGALAVLDDRTLATRIALAGVPAELAPVVEHLNQLLARLDEAFARERTFSAAIAHELRTPVAGLRMQCEVALSRPREAAGYRHTIEQALAISAGMQRMIGALLLLGRLDRNQVPLRPVEHDLGEAVMAAVAQVRPRAEARGLRLACALPTPFRVEGDPDLLGRIIANLLENAVAHADPAGEVAITMEAGAAGWRLTVANPAAGFQPGQLPRIFERFWRGDEARSAVDQHCGLGLALCREIATRLGLVLTASLEQGRFLIVVQASPGSAPAPA